MSVDEFDQNKGSFGSAVCTSMNRVCEAKEAEAQAEGIEPDPCSPCNDRDVEITSGSVDGQGQFTAGSVDGRRLSASSDGSTSKVSFIIRHRPDGPPTPVLRRFFLDWRVLYLQLLGEEGFPSEEDAPPPVTITVIEGGLSAGALNNQLIGEALAGASNVFFSLDGLWACVLMWSLTTRGDACKSKTKSSRLARLMPSSETLQILCLATFFQLVCSLVMHKYIGNQESMVFVVLVGIAVGACGMVFVYALNSWIRGTTFSLKGLDEIDVDGVTYINYEKDLDYYEAKKYSRPYEAGMKGKRALGQLAGHDWEGAHMQWEKAQGLIDLSDEIFDEPVEPEHDQGLVAQFLNSSLLSAFGGGKKAVEQPTVDPNFLPVTVEVQKTISRHVRDALMQWRLRHTAHPVEAEAAGAVLGQLDPNFRVLAVEVPAQARMMLVQAMLQWTQRHPHMQLDAGHATRIQMLLEAIAPRFDGMSLPLPLDDASTTNQVRDLLTDALKTKLSSKSKKDLTQEDGLMLQHLLQQLAPGYALITMETAVPDKLSEDDPEALEHEVQAEIERLAQYAEDIDDDDLYTPVPLILHTEPPEVVEMGRPGAARKASPNGRHTGPRQHNSVGNEGSFRKEKQSPRKGGGGDGDRPPAPERKSHEKRPPSLPPSPPASPLDWAASPSVSASAAKPLLASPSRRFGPKARRVHATWTDPACDSSGASSALRATGAPGGGIRGRAVLGGAEWSDELMASPPPSPPARAGSIPEEEEEEASGVEVSQSNVEVSQSDVEVSQSDVEASQPDVEVSQSSLTGVSQSQSKALYTQSFPEPSTSAVGESKSEVSAIPGGKEIDAQPARSGSNTPADEAAAKNAVLFAKKKKAFFQRRRKKEQKMPCWKQYTMLFIGSVLVGVANVAAITWMATMEPLQAAVSMISWAIGWPCSFIFHLGTRTIMRHLRKKRALARGRMVKGNLKGIYMNDPALKGRPSLQATQRMSAAGGLVARWDLYGQKLGDEEEETKAKPKKGLGAGLKGMCTRRGSGGGTAASERSSADGRGSAVPSLASSGSSSVEPLKREKSSDGMHDKDILKAASRPKSRGKKDKQDKQDPGDPGRQGERDALSTIEASPRPSQLSPREDEAVRVDDVSLTA